MKQFIYIVTAGNQSIEVWELLYTGKMILLQIINTDYNEGQPITISKKRNKLYVGIRPRYKILTYDILMNGTLKKIGETDIPYSPNYLTLDHKEKFLFCSYYHAGCLSVSNINHNNIPDIPIQIISNIKGCHSVQVNLSNNLLLSSSLLSNRIYLLQFFDKTIYKTPLKLLSYSCCIPKSGPRHIIHHNNKNYFYSINELNGTVDVWKINNKKKMIENIQNISLFSDNIEKKFFWSADIHMTSCGKYLYASDRLHSTITIFKIYSNQKIGFIHQIKTIKQPKSFIIDNNNQYLIVIGQKSNTVIVYKISIHNGLLHSLYEYPTGIDPTWIIIHKI